MSDTSKIVELKAENVKKLKAVRITPDGSLVVIGGKNAQGKTSVLDAIMAGLGGKRLTDDKPVREGEEKGFVEIDLGKLLVRRTFTKAGGGTIKVTNKEDNASYGTPQKILDDLMGKIGFDPLEFSKMESKEQLKTLKDVTGLDFSKADEIRKNKYTERTDVNSQIKSLTARINAADLPESAPAEPVNIQALIDDIAAVEEYNRQANRKKEDFERLESKLDSKTSEIEVHKRNYEHKIKELNDEVSSLREVYARLTLECDELKIEDTTETRKELEQAEVLNQAYRTVMEVKGLEDDRRELQGQSDKLTESIEIIDSEKSEKVAAADLPIPDLTFGEDGVIYQGIPFTQASAAEKLRVSLAIGMAMNPKLRVMLVRDGSLLDEDNLKVIADMAKENDFQVWLERVGTGDEVSVIMEDGEVKGGSNE